MTQATAKDTPVLTCSDLKVKRGEAKLVLSDITLKAQESMALAGLIRPYEGEVRLDNQSLWTQSEAGRAKVRGRQIGYVFADFRLIDSLSVMDNLQIARASAHLSLDYEHASTLLERLGISDLSQRRADRLSQGQMQRVALARALMNRPKLILADEPTAALDEDNANQLMTLILELAASYKAAMIVATHDKRVMARLDRLTQVQPQANL
jgi:ABC-type lipoprotein export system ATPase subunit